MIAPRSLAAAAWAAVTVALLWPELSLTLYASCLVAAILLSLVSRTHVPRFTLVAVVVTGLLLTIERLLGPQVAFADWFMFLEHFFGVPVQVDPNLFISRALIVFVVYAVIDGDWRGARVGIFANTLISLAGILALGIAAPFLSLHFLDAAVIILILWAVLLAGNFMIVERVIRSSDEKRPLAPVLHWLACGLAIGILLSTLSATSRTTLAGAQGEAPTVAIFTPEGRGSGREFATSQNRFGLANIGLYGDMAEFLKRQGYRTVEVDSLIGLDAHSVSCLYCAAFPRPLADAETTAVLKFLHRGGTLIAIAEHTNLEGNADILNPLLRSYGLSVNFDNTNGLFGEGLTGSIEGRGDIASTLSLTPYLTHNRGASLRICSRLAQPVLLGRYWQSDRGDSLYPDRAYLSDGRLSTGDRLGNVILMAEARAGKGRVFLSGDSSPFLNQNLAYNAPFLAQLFAIMTRPKRSESSPLIPVIAAVMTAAVIALLYQRQSLRRILASLSLAVLVASSVLASIFGQLECGKAFDIGKGSWTVISTSENNSFDRDPFSPASTTGLALQIFRGGGLPVLGNWERVVPEASAVFILNPTISVSTAYLTSLSSQIDRGAHFVVAGDGDNRSFRAIAANFGFDLAEEPVGSLNGEGLTTYSAWRVRSLPQGVEPLSITGVTIGGTIPHGSGRVTIIADGGFFLSKNLESETAFDADNCRFVRSLLEPR